jgi:hypothetical protein
MNPLTDFNNLQLTYAQTQNAYRINTQFFNHYTRKRLGGIDLPDGVFYWDFSGGFGLPEVGNTRDAIDTSRITDLQFITTIAPTVTLVNAQVRTISRTLSQVAK